MNRESRRVHKTAFRWEWKRFRSAVKYQPKTLQELSRIRINRKVLLQSDINTFDIPNVLKSYLREKYYEDKRRAGFTNISEDIITELNNYSFQDSEQIFNADHKLILLDWQPSYGTLGIFEWNKVHYIHYILVDKRQGSWYNTRYYCSDCIKKVKGPYDKIVKLTGTYAGKYHHDHFVDGFIDDLKQWCCGINCFTFLVSVTDADDWDDWLQTPYHFSEEIDE